MPLSQPADGGQEPFSAVHLQRLTRDLAALHAMPAVWKGQLPEQILAGFVAAIGALLAADAVRVVVHDPATGEDAEHAWPRGSDLPARLSAAALADTTPDEPLVITLPGDGRAFRVLSFPIPQSRGRWRVLVASRRERFPGPDERFVLQGALELVTVAYENAELLLDLRRSQELLELANESANVGVWETDAEAAAVRLDRRALDLLGRVPEPVPGGLRWEEVVHPEDLPRLRQALGRALAERVGLAEDVRTIRAGVVRWLTLIGRAWPDAATQPPAGVRGIVLDSTERRELEERLREAARMESVGRLAGGVAHEANNQMSVVLGTASFLLRRAELTDEVREEVEQIRRAAERTAAVTSQLLAFSRRQAVRPRVVDLNEAVAQAEPVLRRTLSERGRLVVSLAPAPVRVTIDPGQLEQVLLNLTLNARDALREPGTVAVHVDRVAFAEPTRLGEAAAPLPAGRYATLTVRDTGQGIEPETLRHIFEPFFTTKEIGQGTGLGLASVYGIVTQAGGRISVASRPGEGTAFTIHLPAVDAPPAAPAASRPAARVQGGGRTVLVAEDEELVRGLTARILGEAGFRVLAAEDGRAALELIRAHGDEIELAVLDIAMPGPDGYAVAARLRERRPGVPVLLISGHPNGGRSAAGEGATGEAFLQKPFTPEDLLAKLEEVLRAR